MTLNNLLPKRAILMALMALSCLTTVDAFNGPDGDDKTVDSDSFHSPEASPFHSPKNEASGSNNQSRHRSRINEGNATDVKTVARNLMDAFDAVEEEIESEQTADEVPQTQTADADEVLIYADYEFIVQNDPVIYEPLPESDSAPAA